MKKKLFVLLAAVFLAGPFAHAQVSVVSAPILELLSENAFIEQGLYFAQSIASLVDSAMNTYNQVQAAIRAEERALKNLQGITDVKNWDDFMSWYNRQLYLERQTESRFTGMGVTIGKKNYKLKDVASMPYALKSEYVDFWDNEFKEEQRIQMWRGLGLTPSNYAYVKTWQEREQKLLERFIAKAEIQNEEYMADMDRSDGMMTKLMEDSGKPIDEKMSEKELLSMLLEQTIANNKKLNDISMIMAENQDYQATQRLQALTPNDAPVVSEDWNKSYFGRLE
jgi:hypothetical protein